MSHKEIYEALQAVNAELDEAGEALLIDLVEKLRTAIRRGSADAAEATLKTWVDLDAAYAPLD